MKLKSMGSGRWDSDDKRWYVLRERSGRYDVYDKKRKKNDQLSVMGMISVAHCEEAIRGAVWSEKQEKDPSGREKLLGDA